MMGHQEKPMDKQQEIENQNTEKKAKKPAKASPAEQMSSSPAEGVEPKATIKVTFDGDVAQRILKCEAELKDRLTKPDMGKILGAEILTWTDKRWSEIIEENTDIDFFFAQIRKCPDKSKSIKLLKALSEKLKNENPDGSTGMNSGASLGLPIAASDQMQSEVS